MLSLESLRSPWVRLENNAAIKLKMQGRIREILPIVAQPVNPDDIPPTGDTFQHFDATTDYQGVLAKITCVIRRLLE